MTGKNASGPAANRAARRRQNNGGNTGIITDSLSLHNFIMSRTDEPATAGQVRYLQGLRRRHGLVVWNETKAQLGITQAGTEDLSKADAGRLIAALIGGKGESW